MHLTDEFDVEPGDIIWAQIIHSNEYDLWAVKVDDDEVELPEIERPKIEQPE